MCIPFRLMERICPLGRMLAVPPPLRETCLPGRGRLTLDTEPAPPLPALAPPFLPIVEPAPVLPVFPVLFMSPRPFCRRRALSPPQFQAWCPLHLDDLQSQAGWSQAGWWQGAFVRRRSVAGRAA